MLHCAALVKTDKHSLLSVRVRDNQKWYLPGGKIEPGETPKQALIREVKEELGVDLILHSINYLTTIIGDAYGYPGQVELICFSATWQGELTPCAEISEIAYLDWSNQRSLLAPAVVKFCDEWFTKL
jgi:8-oxo-dGTP pyrophosphatase MutT (NUDIX family)